MDDLADKIAARLREKWAIGDFSRFCDEPADFDMAGVEAVAEVIREVMDSEARIRQPPTPPSPSQPFSYPFGKFP